MPLFEDQPSRFRRPSRSGVLRYAVRYVYRSPRRIGIEGFEFHFPETAAGDPFQPLPQPTNRSKITLTPFLSIACGLRKNCGRARSKARRRSGASRRSKRTRVARNSFRLARHHQERSAETGRRLKQPLVLAVEAALNEAAHSVVRQRVFPALRSSRQPETENARYRSQNEKGDR